MFAEKTGLALFLEVSGPIWYALYILAGYWLWKSLKKGGKLGIVILIKEILITLSFLFADPSRYVTAIPAIIVVIWIINFIIAGWGRLH